MTMYLYIHKLENYIKNNQFSQYWFNLQMGEIGTIINNYKELYASANAEELRKKFAGPSWTSMSSVKPPER